MILRVTQLQTRLFLSSVMFVWLRATSRLNTMRFILLMTLAGVLTPNASNANRRLDAMFENPQGIDKSKPATLLIDGKFTVQLFVSIKPVEEEPAQRRTAFANRRRLNRKESSNAKGRISLQLADQKAIVPVPVANKKRTANEGQMKTTTAITKNRFHRPSTTTTRYLMSEYPEEEEADLRWESQKTKNATVKQSRQQALNRTTSSPSSRLRFSRIRTATAGTSKDSRQTHFVIDQRFGNSANKSRAVQNQTKDRSATTNDNMVKVRQTLTMQAARDSTTIDNPVSQPLGDKLLLNEGYVNKQGESITSDKETLYIQKNNETASYALTNNQTTGTRVSIIADKIHSENVSDESVFSRSVSKDRLEETSKFDEVIFRHSVSDRDFSSGSTRQVSNSSTVMTDVVPPQITTPAAKIAKPFNQRKPIANESDDLDGIMTEPSSDAWPITETLTLETVQEHVTMTNHNPVSSLEDPNNLSWKQIGDIKVQTNPKTMQVVDIKSQMASGVHFMTATSHIPISLHSDEESQDFPRVRMRDFGAQIDPQTRQVVNNRTQAETNKHTETMTRSRINSTEQTGENSKEEQGVNHHSNYNPRGGPVQSTTEVLVNNAHTVTAFPLPTATNANSARLPFEEYEEDSTEQKNDYQTQVNEEADKAKNIRTQITTSTLYPTSMNKKETYSSIDTIVGIMHTDTIVVKLPRPINHRVPHITESDTLEDISEELLERNEARKKQIVHSRETISDRVSTVQVGRPSWSDEEEHGIFLLRYVDEDDLPLEYERIAVNPINLKKKKVVIVNPNRDERRIGSQLRPGNSYPKKESPYFYYHYDSSNAVATSSCYLRLLLASVLLLSCCDRITL